MTTGSIRPLALCIFRNEDKILVKEGIDVENQEVIFQPIGGLLHFGEYSWEAIRREIRDELGEEIKNLTFLGPSEQVSRRGESPEHAIVFMFEGEFADADPYQKQELEGRDQHGQAFRAVWKSLKELRRKKARLYPAGILDMI